MFKILKLLLLQNLFYFANSNIENYFYSYSVNYLKLNLLSDYNRDELPNDKMFINITLDINSFLDINQKHGHLISQAWLKTSWIDPQLTWNDSYNLESIKFNSEPNYENSIWTHDIQLVNNLEFENNFKLTRLDVKKNGQVNWIQPGVIKSTCVFNLEDFPYDTQNCQMRFMSLNYNYNQLNIVYNNNLQFNNYESNDEWNLVDTNFFLENYTLDEKFHSLVYEFKLERIPKYYEINIITPFFILSFMSLILLLIPLNSGERISFGITLFLSIFVFLLLISDIMPKSDETPKITKTIILLIVLNFFEIFTTILLTNMDFFRTELEENKADKIKSYLLRIFVHLFKDKRKNDLNLRRSNSYSNATNPNFTNISDECKYVLSKLNFYNNIFFVIFYAAIIIYYIV